MRYLILLPLLLSSLFAHDIIKTVSEKKAVVITLTYPNGMPFSYETYTLYSPKSATVPFQKGVISENGTVAFYPNISGTWTLKANSADGHGAIIKYEAAIDRSSEKNDASLTYFQRIVMGVSLIFGLFGMLTLIKQYKGREK